MCVPMWLRAGLTMWKTVRQTFVPDHTLLWTGDVVIRSAFDYSLVEDIKEIPQDSSHFVGSRKKDISPLATP